jgi:hypothetical protein
MTKFKSEMKQLITAMELYKTTNGKYPNEGLLTYYTRYNDNTELISPSGDIKTLLSPYIKNTPLIPKNNYTPGLSTYTIWINESTGIIYKCSDNINVPAYVISVYPSISKTYSSVSDWSTTLESVFGGPFTPRTSAGIPWRCYSPK